MHYEYRFDKSLLKIGWDILVNAGLQEELSYCHLPQSWDDAQCVDLKKMKIRTGPYILIDDEFLELNDESTTFDYLSEIENCVCNQYNITNMCGELVEPVKHKEFSSFMYDLIMYCMDIRVNGEEDDV
jgi:hypothetical protein